MFAVIDLLESLEIARAVRPRRGVGLASSKSLTDLSRTQYDSPMASTSAQAHSQSQRPKPLAPEIVQSPSPRTISGNQSDAYARCNCTYIIYFNKSHRCSCTVSSIGEARYHRYWYFAITWARSGLKYTSCINVTGRCNCSLRSKG